MATVGVSKGVGFAPASSPPASPGKPRYLARTFSAPKLPTVVSPELARQKQLEILFYLFTMTHRNKEPNQAKGQLAAVMEKNPLYKDQMMRVFNQSLKKDDTDNPLQVKYLSLVRARDKYAEALKKPKHRESLLHCAHKYHQRRDEFKKLHQEFFTEVRKKYGIESPKLKISKGWVKDESKFHLSKEVIKDALIDSIIKKYKEFKAFGRRDERLEALFNQSDYEILKYVDGSDGYDVGGDRSYQAYFNSRIEQVFQQYLKEKLADQDLQSLCSKEGEPRDLYLTQTLSKCNAILNNIRTIASQIANCLENNKQSSELGKSLVAKPAAPKEPPQEPAAKNPPTKGSWVKLMPLKKESEESPKTPRKKDLDSFDTFNAAPYFEPIPPFTNSAKIQQIRNDVFLGVSDIGKGYRMQAQELFDGMIEAINIFETAYHPDFESDPVKQNIKKATLNQLQDCAGRLKFIRFFINAQLEFIDTHLPTLKGEIT